MGGLAALGLAGALVLTGGGHHHATAFTLNVSPAKLTMATGATRLDYGMTVSNDGTRALRVRTGIEQLSGTPGHCAIKAGGATRWAHVSPASFTLAPGQVIHPRLRVHAPAGAGRADLVAVFSGQVLHSGKGNVHLAGAIGSQVIVRPGGAAASSHCTAASGTPAGHATAAGGGLGRAQLAAAGLLVLLLALASAGGLRLARRRSARDAGDASGAAGRGRGDAYLS